MPLKARHTSDVNTQMAYSFPFTVGGTALPVQEHFVERSRSALAYTCAPASSWCLFQALQMCNMLLLMRRMKMRRAQDHPEGDIPVKA